MTATNNIPGAVAPQITPLGSTDTDTAETTNYEISNTTTTTVREPGEVRRLSVAVAVDGKLTPPAGGDGEPTYTARTAEEIAQIEALVKAAVGFNAERGDQVNVTSVRFNRDAPQVGGTDGGSPLFNFTKNDIMRGVELLVLLITGLLLIFFVLRPLMKTAGGGKGGDQPQLTALETALVNAGGGTVALPGQMAQLSGPPSEVEQRLDIARIEGPVKASSIKKVSEFVDKHPEESVAILRNWVHQG